MAYTYAKFELDVLNKNMASNFFSFLEIYWKY